MKLKPYKRNERVAVTFSKEAMTLLNEFSFMTGQPKSALVSEMFDSVLPAMQETIQALRIVKQQPQEAQRLMANLGAQAVRDLSQAQLDLDVALDRRTVKGKRVARRQRAASAP